MSKVFNFAKRNLTILIKRRCHFAKHYAGNREQVGYGINGNPIYFDHPAFPFPAVRWKEPTPELCCLWEKEKGDWSKLSVEEKKELYRASFRQTFSEFQAFLPEWKFVVGITLWAVSVALWLSYAVFHYVAPPYPETFDAEHRSAQCRRIIDLQTNPIRGLASKWDYENNKWK